MRDNLFKLIENDRKMDVNEIQVYVERLMTRPE